jgi:hypothetical protein
VAETPDGIVVADVVVDEPVVESVTSPVELGDAAES